MQLNSNGSPVQYVPFPKYPDLHLHEYDPCVFWHVAFSWQLSVESEHSLISKKLAQCYKILYHLLRWKWNQR